MTTSFPAHCLTFALADHPIHADPTVLNAANSRISFEVDFTKRKNARKGPDHACWLLAT